MLCPCKIQVEPVWSNSEKKMGINAKTVRIGSTDLAASISASLKRARAPDQKPLPGSDVPDIAANKTLKNPALRVSRDGGTRR